MKKTLKYYLIVIMTGVIAIGLNSAYGAKNLLDNGGFEDGSTKGWNTYGDAAMKVVDNEKTEGKRSLEVTVAKKGANFWDSGLQHPNHVFEKGKKYTLAAFLKSSGKLEINFKPELGQDPWTGYGEKRFTMSDKWQEYSTTTAVIGADVKPATITFHIAFDAAKFWIDGVRFFEGDYVPAEQPTAVQPKDKLAVAWGHLKAKK